MTLPPEHRASSLAGRRAIVTGSDVGLGFQSALALALRGAEVTLGVLDVPGGQRSAERIRRLAPAAIIQVGELDLASRESVANFAFSATQGDSEQGPSDLVGSGQGEPRPLDILVNNAGISGHPPVFTVTRDGLERTMATNHLGHFALTAHLLPALLRTPRPRVVSLSSVLHRRGEISAMSPEFLRGTPEGYDVMQRYADSKLICLMFALELDRRCKAAGVSLASVAAHPGVARTLVKSDGTFSRRFWRQDARLGARSQIFAATDPRLGGGEFIGPLFVNRGPATRVRGLSTAYDLELAQKLWESSEAVTGITFDVGSVSHDLGNTKKGAIPVRDDAR